MTIDYAHSIFVVTSSDPTNQTFGTAFVVRTSKTVDTVVTCAHVIHNMPTESILVGGRKADIYKIGQSDGIDLAVLRVPNDGRTASLRLGQRPAEDTECTVAAFDELSKAASLKVFTVSIRESRAISQRRTNTQASAWELKVSNELRPGNSGAPVIDPRTGLVVAILSYRLNEQYGLAIAVENLVQIWREAPLQSAPPTAAHDKFAVHLDFDAWLLQLQRSRLTADRLLLESPPHEDDSPFLRFEDFLDVAHAADLRIAASRHEPTPLRNAREFRVALLTNLIRATGSSAKWAVAKTVEILRRDKVISETSVLFAVWRTLCSGSHYAEEIQRVLGAVFDDMRENNYKRHEHVYEFVTFLMDHAVQTDALSVIADTLRDHDNALGNDAPPAYLERIKRLYGQATAKAERDRTGPRIFEPEVALIPPGDICPYELEAMVYPLTVGEHARLSGRSIPHIAVTTLPYVFEFHTDQGLLFNLLSSEVTSFVNLCNDFNEQEQYVWDVPTICEWLALAGCEKDRFPWGEEQPTTDRANLAFTKHRRLKPVGTFPKGASHHKTLDCCGNVHELVVSSPHAIFHPGDFPHNYRLMGGCFSTPPSHASCHIVRPFRPKEEDHRKNVGLRLIRFSRHDRRRRKEALEQFLASHHRAARFRATEPWTRNARDSF